MTKGTIIRTACLVLALLNTALALFGKSPLPIDNALIEQVVTIGFTTAASLAAWWKNNDFTPEACEGTGLTRMLKANKNTVNGENFFDEVEEIEGGEGDA